MGRQTSALLYLTDQQPRRELPRRRTLPSWPPSPPAARPTLHLPTMSAHKCYNKVLLGNVVSECIEEKNVSTADPDSLNSVVECGVENVFVWLEEKNPKAAKMLGGFLKKLGGDDDDDDE